MSPTLRRIVAALCLVTVLSGCVIVPEHRGYYGPHYGWGWHR